MSDQEQEINTEENGENEQKNETNLDKNDDNNEKEKESVNNEGNNSDNEGKCNETEADDQDNGETEPARVFSLPEKGLYTRKIMYDLKFVDIKEMGYKIYKWLVQMNAIPMMATFSAVTSK